VTKALAVVKLAEALTVEAKAGGLYLTGIGIDTAI